jgi:hypothetical protein
MDPFTYTALTFGAYVVGAMFAPFILGGFIFATMPWGIV